MSSNSLISSLDKIFHIPNDSNELLAVRRKAFIKYLFMSIRRSTVDNGLLVLGWDSCPIFFYFFVLVVVDSFICPSSPTFCFFKSVFLVCLVVVDVAGVFLCCLLLIGQRLLTVSEVVDLERKSNSQSVFPFLTRHFFAPSTSPTNSLNDRHYLHCFKRKKSIQYRV
jgi:hypothetical protein